MDKPRICEVLGVEVGEWWEYGGIEYSVTGKGIIIDHNNTVHFTGLIGAINNPDRIIRKPHFTEQQIELLKTIHMLFPEATHIERLSSGTLGLSNNCVGWITDINENLFPSIHPDRSFVINEIIGDIE